MEILPNKYARTSTSLDDICRELVLRLRHTFGTQLLYVGTTTPLDQELQAVRDLDIMVLVDVVTEGHVYYCQRIVRYLQSRYGTPLDVRIYSQGQIKEEGSDALPIIARYLLGLMLNDLYGTNPLGEYECDPEQVRSACHWVLAESAGQVLSCVSRVSWGSAETTGLCSVVFEALRAFLILDDAPRAGKDEAFRYFQDNYPDFDELVSIYQSYLQPATVVDFAALVLDAYALVMHLEMRARGLRLKDEVVLVNSPSAVVPHPRNEYVRNDPNIPLGLVCVGTYLSSQGVTVRAIDGYAENLGALSVVSRLFPHGHAPRVVGMNCMSPNAHVVQTIARYIKRICPEVMIVAGGPHATLAPEHTLATGHIDFVVLGEGEVTFARLVKELLKPKRDALAKLPGVGRMVAGKLVLRKDRSVLPLAKLPTPDFSLLPTARYFSERRRVYVHSSRGCRFHCIYCSVPDCYGTKVRELPLENLLRDLTLYQEQYQPEEFQIVDDNFSHDPARIREFCRLYRKAGLGMSWKCQARADQLNTETIREMAGAGCFEIDLGIESGNDDVQNYIGKRLDLERTEEMVKQISSAGMRCKAFFMLGFPGETYSQLQDTINYAVRLKSVGLHDVAIFAVMPFPGTRLASEAGVTVFQGAIIDDVNVLDATFAGERLRKYAAKPEVSLNKLFSPEQLRLLVRFAYQMFYLEREVHDLENEFAAYAAMEEGAVYGA